MKKANRKLIIILLILLFLLLIFLIIAITSIKAIYINDNINLANVVVDDVDNIKSKRSIREIIEDSGSKYIKRTDNVITKIYVEFIYDLYDENGKSLKNYFYDLVEELAQVLNKNFHLIDENRNIEIQVIYDSSTETYKIIINSIEDFYEETDGDDYVNLQNAEIVELSDFSVSNNMLLNLANKNMYYSNSVFVDQNKIELENGYYSYDDGTMYAKLAGGRVINIVLTKKYTEQIAYKTKVGTSLQEVNEHFSNLAFGSVKDGYLGYRTRTYYVFLYEDQISLYEYRYAQNNYFDKYLKDYCSTGNLQKLYEDFTGEWTNYFENEYNPEIGRLKLTFPTRGIDIDITNNNSTGIKIYSNYYLTDTVKELIKSNKITLEANKDLIHIYELSRHGTMR